MRPRLHAADLFDRSNLEISGISTSVSNNSGASRVHAGIGIACESEEQPSIPNHAPLRWRGWYDVFNKEFKLCIVPRVLVFARFERRIGPSCNQMFVCLT